MTTPSAPARPLPTPRRVGEAPRHADDWPEDLRGLVASYPRSGLNWVRYCVEHFSGRPTPGLPLLHRDGPFILHRSHDLAGLGWWDQHPWPALYDPAGRPRYRRLLLLLRNYQEARARARQLTDLNPYVGNLRVWQAFPGEKLLVHYEDLMTDFAWMQRILDFLQIPRDLTGFDLQRHQLTSRLIYQARWGGAPDQPAADFTFHSRRLLPAQRAETDAWMREQAGETLYRRHLARYHEHAQALLA